MRGGGASPFVASLEGAGSVIGEMSVLDPAPRAATVVAGDEGARTLRVVGHVFLDALHSDPSIASGLLRVMARRLRGASPQNGPRDAGDPRPVPRFSPRD